MKYMQEGGFQNNAYMRLTLLCTCVFLAGLWVTNFFFYFSKMGLSLQSVMDYYCGSELLFTPPRSYQSMLEVTHMHLPMMAIVVLLLTHLLIFAPLSGRIKKWSILLAFGTALMNEGAGWLVRFAHPHFAVLKVAAFLSFQAIFAGLLVAFVSFLLRSTEAAPQLKKLK
ncbi:MAG: hypothetical protein A2992_02780 [Elusimicrobia bacterium RIFCSPLOWO2_01_FULL_59_12]|nr:MAG: hypothetical protein A2992_02780 [Elusimicrobia bacterium RIFCSPLOWO2_01_FULL_59_12]